MKVFSLSHLGAAGDGAGGKTNGRSPANIPHPITVGLQLLVLLPLTVLLSAGRRRQLETDGDSWRQMETVGDRWRQMETDGDR